MVDRRVLVTATILLAVLAAACSVPAGSTSPAATDSGPTRTESTGASPSRTVETAPSSLPAEPVRTVEDTGGFRLATLSSAACTADAPADWTMQAPDTSDRADLMNPDGSLYAGYGIAPVNTALQPYAAAYDPPLNDPGLFSPEPAQVAQAYGRIVVGLLGGGPDLVAGAFADPLPDYRLVSVEGASHRGLIFFHGTGFAGDGLIYTYALPMYFAFTTRDRWADQGLLVARVAAGIRCTTQFQPRDDYPVVEAAPAGDAADVNAVEPGYDPQLGTEPVHDPTTGENYLVDPSVNWSETGPEGPGYYVPKGGNDYQKLEPGRID